VLLELLDSLTHEWLEHLMKELPSAVSAKAVYERRAEQLARAYSRSLAERPVLCDLLSAQAAVLEHNVSVEAIASFKRRGIAKANTLVRLVGDVLPELTEDQAWRLFLGALLMTSAIWSHATPPQAVLDVYERHPELGAMRLEFAPTLEDYVVTLALGLHA
jgi:Tetracyclin repressor-like, C-terminal domain